MLENEPDFLNKKSLLEIEITRYEVLFLIPPQIMAHKLEITRLGTNASFTQSFFANLT